MVIIHACHMVAERAACTMIIFHAWTMINVHACSMIKVHACNMVTIHACTMTIVHACITAIVYVSCPIQLMVGGNKGGGTAGATPLGRAGGLGGAGRSSPYALDQHVGLPELVKFSLGVRRRRGC